MYNKIPETSRLSEEKTNLVHGEKHLPVIFCNVYVLYIDDINSDWTVKQIKWRCTLSAIGILSVQKEC